jgi:hypothetical protein
VTQTTFFQGALRYDIPWATSFEPNFYIMGVLRSSAVQQATLAGVTYTNGFWVLRMAHLSFSAWGYRTGPNDTASTLGPALGVGSVSSAGGVVPTSINVTNISQTGNSALFPYCQMGIL